MNKIKVVDIKLKIIRGRSSPGEMRFKYSTLIEYFLEDKENGKRIIMGITPSTYFFIKQVLKEGLNDLERVIFHNIRVDSRKSLHELFIENNLLNISLKKEMVEVIDKVVIDNLKSFGKSGYNFSASLFLNNGQRIPNIIPSDAIVLALLANKDIYISNSILEEKEKIDKEFDEIVESKRDTYNEGEKEQKKGKIPENIYT
ncbi:MAG: hypothetical protein ACFFD2_01365 [Promethearchaeota archaeon]